MRFHDSFIGLFFMILGGLVLWQVASFPDMPGQAIGPATFPSIFGYAFLAGGGLLLFKSRRLRMSSLVVIDDGWRMTDRAGAALLAILGTLILALYFEEIGFTIGISILMSALYIVMGYRPLFWIVLSIAFSLAMYYGIAKGLAVPLPLGIFF